MKHVILLKGLRSLSFRRNMVISVSGVSAGVSVTKVRGLSERLNYEIITDYKTANLKSNEVKYLKLSSNELQCKNLMCEKLGTPCVCRLALFLYEHHFPLMETLDLCNQGIKALPDTISSLKNLRVLDVRNNSISNLSASTLNGLEFLEKVDVRGNPSISIDEKLFNVCALKRDGLFFDADAKFV